MGIVTGRKEIFFRQVHEVAEWIGFESRNKFEILDAQRNKIGYAAEQQKGWGGFFMRQLLGHWRSFTLLIFDNARQVYLRAEHPFRWYFERLEIYEPSGELIGAIQKRFAILYKKFDVENAKGQVILNVNSPFWRIWTFPFKRNDRVLATVAKKWSGIFSEVFTDRDNFNIQFQSPELTETERKLILASGLYIDLHYFEKKAGKR